MAIAVACVAALAAASPAAALEPAAKYNVDPFVPRDSAGNEINSVQFECVPANNRSTRMYFFDPGSTGSLRSLYTWDNLVWAPILRSDGTSSPPCPNADANGPNGYLRFSRWEKPYITATERGYVMRGAGGRSESEPNIRGIRFGHALGSDAKNTSVFYDPTVGRDYRPKNSYGVRPGDPAPCNGKIYDNRPQNGTNGMNRFFYKPVVDQVDNDGIGSGPDGVPDDGSYPNWVNYGDQAQGGPQPYNYVLWTWPAKPGTASENDGGGQIRLVIPTGADIRACDVEPEYLPAWKPNDPASAPTGRVKMMYGRVSNGASTLYGWFVVAWVDDAETTRYWRYLVA